MIIGIDHGNKQVKVPHKIFTSGLLESNIPFPLSSDSLYYNGKYYALTDERIPYMRDKTVNEKFFILTLFGIAYELMYSNKYVPGMTTEIQLGIGLPPGHFGTLYKKFEKYFTRNEPITFEFNQRTFNIVIKSAHAYPQGYAAISLDSELPIKICKNCNVPFIPIGRPDTLYCSRVMPGFKYKCSDIGASNTYKRKQSDIEAEYFTVRKRYHIRTIRNPCLQPGFDAWKVKAKEKLSEYRNGLISADEFRKWFLNDEWIKN